MDYRTLGRSGCAVSSLALGTMTFGQETDEPEAHRQLDLFAESGGTLVDTADVYGAGASEQIIGSWLAARPAATTGRVVLATKGRFPTDDSPNGAGLSAVHLTRALDASLRRLGVDLGSFPPSAPPHRSAKGFRTKYARVPSSGIERLRGPLPRTCHPGRRSETEELTRMETLPATAVQPTSSSDAW